MAITRRNDGIFCLVYKLKNVNSGNFLLVSLKLERDLSSACAEKLALLPFKSLVCTQGYGLLFSATGQQNLDRVRGVCTLLTTPAFTPQANFPTHNLNFHLK